MVMAAATDPPLVIAGTKHTCTPYMYTIHVEALVVMCC